MLSNFRWRALTLIGAVISVAVGGCQSASQTQTEQVQAAPVETLEEQPAEVFPSEAPALEEAQPNLAEISLPESVVEVRPRTRNDFAAQAARYGAEPFRQEEGGEWQARKGSRLLTLKESSRVAMLDGVAVYLDAPFGRNRGSWALSQSDERILLESVFGREADAARSVRRIVLDPGHGGSEDGARNDRLGLKEKELNLDLAQRLKGHLETMGYQITMTRYDDRLVTLDERPAIANKTKADLFVSLHFNAAENAEAKGLETYMLTPPNMPSTSSDGTSRGPFEHPANRFEAENFELAYRIQKSMVSRLQREDRGVRKARFHVLKTLDCPGVLVEGGFVSNADEAPLVGTAGYRERLARSLAEAIDGYARNLPLGEL